MIAGFTCGLAIIWVWFSIKLSKDNHDFTLSRYFRPWQ